LRVHPLLCSAQRLILARVRVLLSVRLQGGITVRGRLLSVALIASFLAANVAVAATNPPGQLHSQKKKHSGHHGKKHSQQHSGAHKKNSNKLHNGQ
jgi:hypothetical protein